MYAAERSVLNTIAQALELASMFAAHEVGLVLDVFHIWWDPQVLPMIAQCRGRIYGFHVNDWLVPTRDLLLDRVTRIVKATRPDGTPTASGLVPSNKSVPPQVAM